MQTPDRKKQAGRGTLPPEGSTGPAHKLSGQHRDRTAKPSEAEAQRGCWSPEKYGGFGLAVASGSGETGRFQGGTSDHRVPATGLLVAP